MNARSRTACRPGKPFSKSARSTQNAYDAEAVTTRRQGTGADCPAPTDLFVAETPKMCRGPWSSRLVVNRGVGGARFHGLGGRREEDEHADEREEQVTVDEAKHKKGARQPPEAQPIVARMRSKRVASAARRIRPPSIGKRG